MKLGSIGGTVTAAEPPLPVEISIPTLESIAYQRNDKFGSQIEEIVIKFMDKVNAGATSVQIDSDHKLKEELQSLVHKRLGIKAILYCDGIIAATFPNVYVNHSPIIGQNLQEYFKLDQGAAGAIKLKSKETGTSLGSVNTETAKVSGWMSEQEVAVYINFNDLMKGKLSSAEITAVILHELGHDFEGAAMASRATSTNVIISDVIRHIVNKERGGNQEYVYHELRKLDDKLSKDTVDGLMNGSPVVMGVSAFRLAQGTIRSLSGSRIYNSTNYEALSDSFATRFGYGEPLATGLAKMTELHKYVNMAMQVVEILIAYSVIMSLYSLVGALLSGAMVGKTLLAILFRAAGLLAIVNRNRTTKTDMVYDDEYDRFARIKKDLIGSLKDAKVSSAEKRLILEQLLTIEKILDKSFNTPKPVRELINKLIPSDGIAQNSIDNQKRLENLIANDIFNSANKLALKSA